VSRFPLNAQSLVDLRMRGVVPELPVLLSFVGPLNDFTNVTLIADAARSYEWRCIQGLEVEVFVSRSVLMGDVLRQLADIAAAVPDRMVLTFVEGPRIDCGEMRVVPHPEGDFGLFDWFPMAVGPKWYAEGAKVAKRLWQELGHALPIPFDRAFGLLLQIANERGASCA